MSDNSLGMNRTLQIQLLDYSLLPVPMKRISSSGAPCNQLSLEHVEHALSFAGEFGGQRVHIIGGEPTLSPLLLPSLALATDQGITDIHVLSGLSYVPLCLVQQFRDHNVKLKTWFYSDDADIHEEMTGDICSWTHTLQGMEICLSLGVDLEVCIPLLEETLDRLEETICFLQDLGIRNIRCIEDLTLKDVLGPGTRTAKPVGKTARKHINKTRRASTGQVSIWANGDASFETETCHRFLGSLHYAPLQDLLFLDQRETLF
ncbi:MAG: hypothetical protein ACRBBN_05465 [Methyloligellaceae bacterium]